MNYANTNSKNYEVIRTFVAGMCLDGKTVSRMRSGEDIGLSAAWVEIRDGSAFIILKEGAVQNRFRLLLNKAEIRKLSFDLKKPSATIIPLRIFIAKTAGRGREVFKCNIASAKGLRQYDKRRKMIDSIHRKEGKIQ